MDPGLDARLLRFRSRPEGEDATALAEALLASARHHEAMEVAAEGLKARPHHIPLLVVVGRALHAAGDPVRAQAILTEAAKLSPSAVAAYRYLGEILLERGDVDRAVKVLSRALAVDARYPDLKALHERATRAQRGAAAPRSDAAKRAPPGAPLAPTVKVAAMTEVAADLERAAPVVAMPVIAEPPVAAVAAPPPPAAAAPAPVSAPTATRADAAAPLDAAPKLPPQARPPAGLWSRPPPAASPAPARAPAVRMEPGAPRLDAPPPGVADLSRHPAPNAPAPAKPPRSRTMLGVGAFGELAGPKAAPAAPTAPAASAGVPAPQAPSTPKVAEPKASAPLPPPAEVAAVVPPPSASAISADAPVRGARTRKGTLLDSAPPPARSTDAAVRVEPPRSERPSKATLRGMEDSEPPTALRAPALDSDARALLLGASDMKRARAAAVSVPSAPAPYVPPPPTPLPPESDEALARDVFPASLGVPPTFEDAATRVAEASATAVSVEPPALAPPSDPYAEEFPSGPMVPPEPDASGGDAVGAPDPVDRVLLLLEERGLFERPDGAEQAWAARGDLSPTGTRLGRTMAVVWVLGLLLVAGGYFGFREWVARRHAEASRLVAESRAHGVRGDHRDLIDAERKLRFARDLHPHEPSVMRELLFVQSQRALEEGSFEAGFLRSTIASAERRKLDAPELDAARAIVSASDGQATEAEAGLAKVRQAGAKDPRLGYLAGRLGQRLAADTALAELEAAMNAERAPVAARLAVAEAYADAGRRDEAVAVLRTTLTATPDHLRASLWDAWIRAADSDVEPSLVALAGLEKRLDVGAPTDKVIAALARARLLRRKGSAADATAAVEAAVRAGVAEPRLLALVAAEAKSLGLSSRAQAAAMDAVARAPMNPDFRKLLASILLDDRDGVRALRELEGLSTDDPTVLEMSARAALLVGTEKVLAKAQELLRSYEQRHEDTGPGLRALRIRVDAALGAAPAALVEARALLAANRRDPAILVAVGEIALRAGDVEGARTALVELSKLDATDADAYFLLGRAERAAGRAEAAEKGFRRALELSPAHLAARRALGRLLLDTGKYEEADALFEGLSRSIGVAAGETSVLLGRLGRAEALLGLGRVADARAQVASLREEDRVLPSAAVVSALVAIAEGKPGEAVAALRSVATAPDATADLVATYAQALFDAGDVTVANREFDRALGLDGELPEALLGKAQTALRAEKPRDAHANLDAVEAALKARIRPPRLTALALTLRGRAFLLEGRAKVDPAREVLRAAVATPGAPPEAHFFLGESLAAANSPEAYEAYGKYLALSPEGEFAKRAERAMRRK